MILASAPTLETARLRLRAAHADDFAAYAAMWADPEVVRHVGGRPFTREEAWTRLLRGAGMWPLMGYGFWTVTERSGAFVGTVGIQEVRRGMTPAIEGVPEVGWALARSAQGKGYAAEALEALLAWADGNLPYEACCCIIEPQHLRSIALAHRFGFREQGEAIYGGVTLKRFRRPRGG